MKKIFLIIFLLCLGVFFSIKQSLKKPPVVAAHYYSWFPENWNGGFVGEKLVPPIMPLLGKYQSNEETFKKHLQWAKAAGINLFIFDWWAKRRDLRKKVEKETKILEETKELSFAIQYEVFDLKDKGDEEVLGEAGNVIYMNQERVERLKTHLEHLAKKFMFNPQYFRIDNKPVLFIYVTRQLVGDVASAIKAARAHVKEITGLDLYLVADEVYYNVLDYNQKDGVYMHQTLDPDLGRIKAFDALTCYNPYWSDQKEHSGEDGIENFFRDVDQLYSKYSKVAKDNGLDFFPGILAGYNDRGVRLKENHFVIPHYYQNKTGEQKSFFQENLQRFATKYLSKRNPLFVITSWNEWNEGSQIEPTVETAETTKDLSESDDYTQGFKYFGYGDRHLTELKQFLLQN